MDKVLSWETLRTHHAAQKRTHHNADTEFSCHVRVTSPPTIELHQNVYITSLLRTLTLMMALSEDATSKSTESTPSPAAPPPPPPPLETHVASPSPPQPLLLPAPAAAPAPASLLPFAPLPPAELPPSPPGNVIAMLSHEVCPRKVQQKVIPTHIGQRKDHAVGHYKQTRRRIAVFSGQRGRPPPPPRNGSRL